MRALFEDVPLAGKTVTLDALREQHRAHMLCRVRGNCPVTYARLRSLVWSTAHLRRYGESWAPRHGHWERRRMEAAEVESADQLRFPDVQQVFRVTYRSKPTLEGRAKVEEIHYGLTSLSAARAGACRLLTLHRGHWSVGSSNHYSRDMSRLENRSQIRTGHESANNAALNNLAQALIKRSGQFATVGDGLAHYSANREAVPEALLTRQQGRVGSGGNGSQTRERPAGKGVGVPAGRFRGTGRDVELAVRATARDPSHADRLRIDTQLFPRVGSTSKVLQRAQ